MSDASTPVSPMPVTAFNRRLLDEMSVPASPPSVMVPVRAVNVMRLPLLLSSVTDTDAPTIVRSSLKLDESTSTVPVPSASRPIVISEKPLANAAMSVSVRSKLSNRFVPMSTVLPMLMFCATVSGWSTMAPALFVATESVPPVKSTSSAVMLIPPLRTMTPSNVTTRALITVNVWRASVLPTSPVSRMSPLVPAVNVSVRLLAAASASTVASDGVVPVIVMFAPAAELPPSVVSSITFAPTMTLSLIRIALP